jgi:parallel beta-helix repeat protein
MSRRLFLAALLVVSLPLAAEAATLWVATNGVDTVAAPECGKLTTPCRSINKALSLANDGDSITVLPGRYGLATEPAPEPCLNCLINVHKRVTITSRDGASETIIDAAGVSGDAVIITANKVNFGRRLKGFSLVNAGAAGLAVAGGVTGAMIVGNQAGSNSVGFEITGVGAEVTANRSGGNTFSGFSVRGSSNELMGNLAAGNGLGFAVFDSGHTLNGNIAIDNGDGFNIFDGSANILLTGNAALGNIGPGVRIGGGTGVTNISVIKGSIFGNDEGGINCGLLNESSATINAIMNFWGAAIGPSLNPGDSICNSGVGEITVDPVGKREVNPRSP